MAEIEKGTEVKPPKLEPPKVFNRDGVEITPVRPAPPKKPDKPPEEK